MTNRIIVAVLTLSVAILPLAASAGEVGQRVSDEQGRINAGVRSGQITPGENAGLQRRLNAINRTRERDLTFHNGHLTRSETHRLNRDENRLSHRIVVDTHNVRRDPGAPLR